MARKIKPRWWLLYLTLPLMIGLLVLEGRLADPPIVHQILEFGIVIVCFGLMAVWVHASEGALLNEEFEKERWRLRHDCMEEEELDPHRLPLAEDREELEEGQYHLEVGPSKGRDNEHAVSTSTGNYIIPRVERDHRDSLSIGCDRGCSGRLSRSGER